MKLWDKSPGLAIKWQGQFFRTRNQEKSILILETPETSAAEENDGDVLLQVPEAQPSSSETLHKFCIVGNKQYSEILKKININAFVPSVIKKLLRNKEKFAKIRTKMTEIFISLAFNFEKFSGRTLAMLPLAAAVHIHWIKQKRNITVMACAGIGPGGINLHWMSLDRLWPCREPTRYIYCWIASIQSPINLSIA